MIDVIKEYLVSLGFKVDTSSYDKAVGAMGKAEKSVSSFAGTAISQFAAAGVAVTTFVALANVGIAKFIGGLAYAELENQKFARKMWTTEENAKSLKTSLDAMGASLEDLYYSPELLQNFLKLRQQATEMGPPTEYKEQMKYIRSIGFEFQRLKLEATYAMQWIGYYIYKYLEAPIKQFKEIIKGANDTIEKNMPQWTKQIAQVVSWFGRMGVAAVKAGDSIIKLFKSLPTEIKVAGGAMAGFFALLKMGPIGWIIGGLTALLVLLDDFYTYQAGGESALGTLWEDLENKKGLFGDDGPLGQLQKILEKVWNISGDIVQDFIKGVDWEATKKNLAAMGTEVGGIVNSLLDIVGIVQKTGIFEAFGKAFHLVFDGILAVLQAINKELKLISESFTIGPQQAFRNFGNNMKNDWDKQRQENPDQWDIMDKIMSPFAEIQKWIDDKKPLRWFDDRVNKNAFNEILDIQGYAEGGRITSPRIAKLGEGGDEEYVIPINNKPRSLSLWQKAGEALGALAANPYMQQMAQNKVDYIMPQYHTTNKTSLVLSPTYNINGSDPNLTAKAAERSMDSILMRNFQGVFR